MDSIDQTPISSQQTTATTSVVSTPIYREPHILDREPHIYLATPFEKLEVLCESLVDFENMKRNGVDLTKELRMQGWETYFQRLYDPVYTYLVKEFWSFTYSYDHYIVSDVLGFKIVITEKSIASLLNMEKTGGRRIYNINPRSKYLSQEIAPTIFQQNAKGKQSKNKELHQNLRFWLNIILGTIHHHPASNSSDYINTYQKCILYCIHKGLKLNLPALLFKYLRDSVKDTRNNMKTRNYIPLGRIISDVLIESGLVDHLIHHNLMEDVTVDIGRPLNARNLKSIGIIEQVRAKPTLDTSWEALKDQRKIPNGLYLFSKIDPPKVVVHYLQDLTNQGVDISEFSVDWLPEHPPNFMKRMREPSEKSKKAKKAKLGETSGSRPPVPLADSRTEAVAEAEAKAKAEAEEAAHVVAEEATKATFKLKGLSEQVRKDFIRDVGIRLHARLAREAEEKARKEGEEKYLLEEEQRIREAEEKGVAEAAAEAEAKAKAEAEEAAHIAAEEAAKASADALTQWEKFTSVRTKGKDNTISFRDLAYEPDVVVVDDVETTTQKVDGQNDMQLVAETNVTHHTKTEALTDMVVTPQGDTEVMEGHAMEVEFHGYCVNGYLECYLTISHPRIIPPVEHAYDIEPSDVGGASDNLPNLHLV
ncbi:uncharacterized protein LOC127103091 [Lathyrus oleraceus]|uniref:uncharacterized protein LOC127103091 n=1 Tax=Pisum sativum TaxID=3888 RepID=UPI0021D31ECD|nr:uncharacterized protein LOC127103091 [Pisum sativum]